MSFGREKIDTLIVGVGGQGVILASGILAQAALRHGGLEVKQSETHGMSQRGGSVHAHIRIGERVVSPAIAPGEVDLLLAFEVAEAVRWVPSLAPTGVVIVGEERIVPPLAAVGMAGYPDDALDRLAVLGRRLVVVDGAAIAQRVGSPKVASVVLLGALARYLPFARETWQEAIGAVVAPAWLPMNLAAFEAGWGVEGS